MLRTALLAAVAACLLAVASIDAAQPASAVEIIVLVHGLAGWGESELGTFRYWGQWFFSNPQTDTGRNNVVKRLKDATGLPVYVATVGPFSSNHERACELYAQIRGLRTDYGATRAALTSGQRFAPAGSSMDFSGKPAWLPNWGLPGNADKIHLVGHSMGAPTVRMLEYLMRFGKADETSADKSELFKTGVNRGASIKTLTTIAGVNDGSTLHSKLGGFIVDKIKDLLFGIASIDAAFTWQSGTNHLYDLDLRRLNIPPQAGESFTTYVSRVFASPTFSPTYKYLAHYDLSPGFMREFNTLPGTYRGYDTTKYLAISTSRTSFCPLWPGDQCAGTWMEAILKPTATLIGDMDGVKDVYNAAITFGDADEENDGLVSRKSTRGPQAGALLAGRTGPAPVPMKTVCTAWILGVCSSSYTTEAWEAVQTGQWVYKDFNYDHLQAVGFQITGWTGPFQDPVGDIFVGQIGPFIKANKA